MAAYVGSAALMISLIVPIIAVILAIIRIFYRNVKIKGIALWGLGLLWLGSLLTLIVIGTTVFRQFSTGDSSTQNITLNNPNAETMSIELKQDKDDDNDDMDLSFGNMFLRGDVLMSDNIDFDVEQSPDAQFHLIQKNTARGATAIEARRAADEVEYKIIQTDSSLLFDPLLSLPKGAKCKWQKIKLTLQVPIGKKIKVKNVEHDRSRFDDFTNDIYLARTESCKDYESENDPRHVFMYKTRTWRMGQNGLLCDDCTPEELTRFTISNEKDEDSQNNNDEDGFSVGNEDSDSTSININGDDAKIKLDENGLSIKSNKKGENVEIKIDEDGFKVKKNGKTIRPNEN